MKFCATFLVGTLGVLAMVGCGSSPDRESLATHTVKTYWYDIGHGKIPQAYKLISPGVQAARPLDQYRQDMFQFLVTMGGITAKTGKPSVDGDQASVPVTLTSPKTAEKLNAYQHLYWDNGQWRITDPNGGLSRVK